MSGIETEDKVVPVEEMKKLQERIRRLEMLLGQKTEDVEILKGAIRIARHWSVWKISSSRRGQGA